jgi:hypothetical protein
MLIRDEMAGMEGRAADAALRPSISPASSLPTLILGGLLLLIGP